MTNILISALSNTAQLTICLVILFVMLAADVIAILGLFNWKKKFDKYYVTAMEGETSGADRTDSEAVVENPTDASQQPDGLQQTAEATQVPVEEGQASDTQQTDASATEQAAAEQPLDTQIATENSANQEEGAQPQQQVASQQESEPQTNDVESSKPSALSAFMLAPFMTLSAASAVPALRTMVYLFGAIALLASVGAVVLGAIFAKQINDKIKLMPKKQQEVPQEAPVEEPIAEAEPTVQPVEEAQPIEEVQPEPEPEAVVEEPQEEPTPVVEEVQPTVAEEPTVEPAVEEDEEDDEDEEEDEGPIFVETDDGEGYFIILEKTFTARIIQSKQNVKTYYSHIKNEFLSYKKCAARMSKPRESFRIGKVTIAKLAIRGKTLKLYLALDPSKYIDGRYKIEDESDVISMADTPLLLKINSERKCEYAMELIEDLMVKFDAVLDDKFKEVDYVKEMPYETTDALVEKGLIVKKLAKGKSLFDSKVVDVHVPESKQAEEEPVVEEPAPIENKDDIYERSFSAKLMQSSDAMKNRYSKIKNILMSYAKVNARISKKREAYRFGKDMVANVTIKDNSLRVYFALDPKSYDGRDFKVTDVSNVGNLGETPTLYTVEGDKDIAVIQWLAEDLMKKVGAEEKETKPNVNYAKQYPYMTDEELFEQGLIVMREVVGTSFADYQSKEEVAAADANSEKKPTQKKPAAPKKTTAKTASTASKTAAAKKTTPTAKKTTPTAKK